jgi:GT2 family glycosyltransferase
VKVSLVVCTVSRTTEIVALFDSLRRQRHHDMEVVLVDQNQDARLHGLASAYSGELRIRHVLSPVPGLSHSRNVGLGFASGDVVSFPDDDCLYPVDTLRRVVALLTRHPELDGVTGRAVSPIDGQESWRFKRTGGMVTKRNVLQTGTSFTMFLRGHLVRQVGGFDEEMGLGPCTTWKAGEDTDYLLRCVRKGARIRYVPALTVLHPKEYTEAATRDASRAYEYGRGIAHVLVKHRYGVVSKLWFVAKPALRYVFSLVTLRRTRAKVYKSSFAGRCAGLRG